MTLVVEDGSAVAGANSYVSLATADAYFAARNNLTWDALDPTDTKTPYLILAVDYMQQAYRTRWKGWRHLTTQVLDWPRLWVDQFDSPGNYGPFPYYFPPNTIPQEVITAQLLLALKLTNGDLAPDLERVEQIVKVGSLQVTYDDRRPPFTIFRDVEMLLSPFFESSGGMARIGRL